MYEELKLLRHFLTLKRTVKKLRILIIFLALQPFDLFAAPPTPIPPDGDAWQIVVRDKENNAYGIGSLTFNNDGTLGGFMIAEKGTSANDAGFFNLAGEWTDDGEGGFTGFVTGESEAACGPTDLVFDIESFKGHARTSAKGVDSLVLFGKLGNKEINVKGERPADLPADISGAFLAKTTIVKVGTSGTGTASTTTKTRSRILENIDLAASALALDNVFDLTGTGPGHSLIGCAIVDSRGRLALTAQQDDDDSVRTLIGTAKTPGTLSLSGVDLVDDKPQNIAMTMQ
jgi:hypothetical protein